MTSKLTRERLAKIKSWRETYGAGSNVMLPAEEAEELARMALSAFDSEPVAWTWQHLKQWHVTNDEERVRDLAWDGVKVEPLYRHARPAKGLELAGWQFKSVNGDWVGLIDEHGKNQAVREGCEVREVFAMADGVNDRDQVRIAHAEWSQATFGNVGPVGPLKHLAKEAMEAAVEPDDLSEWADMQFLLWDAQRRAGVTDEQITQAMIDKLAVNKQRKWPEPKDGEPRLHIKEQPAPVVPDSYVMVPMRLTAENGAKGALSGEFSETKFVNCPECFGDDECETCDGSGKIEITVPVTWTTIKAIWVKGVEHFAATAQEND